MTTVDKNVEKSEVSYVAGGNVKWCTFWETVWQFLKMLNMGLSYDAAILLVGIYPREMKTHPYKNLYMNVHSIIIHNSQEMN